MENGLQNHYSTTNFPGTALNNKKEWDYAVAG
jgi:hypothetical protein